MFCRVVEIKHLQCMALPASTPSAPPTLFLQVPLAPLDLLKLDLIPVNLAGPDQGLFLEMIHPDLMRLREVVLSLAMSTMEAGSLL